MSAPLTPSTALARGRELFAECLIPHEHDRSGRADAAWNEFAAQCVETFGARVFARMCAALRLETIDRLTQTRRGEKGTDDNVHVA